MTSVTVKPRMTVMARASTNLPNQTTEAPPHDLVSGYINITTTVKSELAVRSPMSRRLHTLYIPLWEEQKWMILCHLTLPSPQRGKNTQDQMYMSPGSKQTDL